MVTSLQIDLHKVKLSLDSALDDNLHKQQEAMSAIADINEQLTQLADQQSQHREEIAQHATLLTQKRAEQTAKDAELRHVAGTAFEVEIRSAIADLVAQQEDTTAKVKQAQRSHDKADQDASALRDQIATQKGVLADLQAKERELSATRDGYDQRHAHAVLDECLSELATVRAEVMAKEQALQEAKAKEQAKQHEIAQRLSEWPNLLFRTANEHFSFEPHAEVSALRLKKQLCEIVETNAKDLPDLAYKSLSFQLPPVTVLEHEGTRDNYAATQERTRERMRNMYGYEPAAIDGYHNRPMDQFVADCTALDAALERAEARRQEESASRLAGK